MSIKGKLMGIADGITGNSVFGTKTSQTSGALGLASQQAQSILDRQMMEQLYSAQVLNHPSNIATTVSDKKFLSITMRQISNGFVLSMNGEDVYVADLSEIGDKIAAHWVAKKMGVFDENNSAKSNYR